MEPYVEPEVIATDADTIDINDKVETVLNEYSKFPDDIKAQTSVKSALSHSAAKHLAIGLVGLILVALALVILLEFESLSQLDWYSFGLFGNARCFVRLGHSINLITVIGMFIMIGILVDDAIIVTDRYKQLRSEGLSFMPP